jgi:MFS-type transporter involved in bile tolerance (Atg22 family)
METKLWQSEPVRAFGKYFNEIYLGFFRYRWSNQPFFAMAMGLFVGPDFQKYTTDYTDGTSGVSGQEPNLLSKRRLL